MHWIDDTVAISKLEAFDPKHFKYHYGTNIRVSTLRLKESLKNNARLGDALIDELVNEYAKAMKNGAGFPAVIITEDGDILSGIHRVYATLKAGFKTVDAYVVTKASTKDLDIITRCANRWTGRRQDKDEAVHHALALTQAHAMSRAEAARQLGLEYTWLCGQIRAIELGDELSNSGIDVKNIARTSLERLNTLADNKTVVMEAARISNDYKMPLDEIARMTTDVRKGNNEQERMTILKKWNVKMNKREPRGRTQRAPNRTRMVRYFVRSGSLHDFITTGHKGEAFTSFDQLEITDPEEVERLHENYREIKKIMEPMFRDFEDNKRKTLREAKDDGSNGKKNAKASKRQAKRTHRRTKAKRT